MAVIRQGGGPNPPVQLDPVQQLVNVHWPAKYTHIAYRMGKFDISRAVGSTTTNGPPYDELDAGADYATWTASAQIAEAFLGKEAWGLTTAGEWEQISVSALGLTGLRFDNGFLGFVATETFDPFEIPLGNSTAEVFTQIGTDADGPVYGHPPASGVSISMGLEWTEATGVPVTRTDADDEEVPITVPEDAAVFHSGLDNTVHGEVGAEFEDDVKHIHASTGGAFPSHFFPVRRKVVEGTTEFLSSTPVPPDVDATATYKDSTYNAVGSKLIGDGDEADKQLWVLFKLEEETD